MTDTIDSSSWGEEPMSGNPEKLPVFLKVLCILTFVGSGFTILGGIYNLAMAETTEISLRQMLTSGNPLFGSGKVNMMQLSNYFNWVKIASYVSLCAGILTLVGAIAMWKRRKTGFFVYVIGEVAPVFTTIMLIKVSSGIPVVGMSTAIGGIGIVFIAAFVIMYSLNYKHLR